MLLVPLIDAVSSIAHFAARCRDNRMNGSCARGSANETRTFFSDRFVPGEHVVTWLNTPRGVKPLDVASAADPSGRVWLSYRPSDLTPGTYQIVAHGTRSRLTGVASFVVR